MKALIGANLIDGTGGPVIDDATVLIDGERIVETGRRAAVELPPNTEIVDLSGMTLLPGLIDCHDHLASKDYRPGQPNGHQRAAFPATPAHGQSVGTDPGRRLHLRPRRRGLGRRFQAGSGAGTFIPARGW